MSNFSRDITIDQIVNVIDFYEPHYFGYYSKLYQFNITVIIPALYLAIKFPYMNPDTQDPIISIAFRDHSLIVEVATIIFDLKRRVTTELFKDAGTLLTIFFLTVVMKGVTSGHSFQGWMGLI